MKLVIALFALVAVAVGAPPTPESQARVLKNEVDNIGVDGYNFSYETSNGISAGEQGQVVNAGSENEAIAVRGQFKYTGADGIVYSVSYIADENGFQAEGAHLPAIIIFAIAAVALAAPPTPDSQAAVLRNEVDNIGVDGYNFSYETSNGIAAGEQGQVVNAGAENEALVVRGQFQYTGADGVLYSVSYVADENGFQPQGAHLPVAPQ
ncbi:hypothetical protein D910_04965 [Dendroctonus ponderosae]|uniref:Cuticle protein n=1 Tax=Dendroctonus ponderosae TaxID=77166 RepID=U4U131_DENPD|nr:hypothetical protein D910_04965 [Dendroctonus ponderosae]